MPLTNKLAEKEQEQQNEQKEVEEKVESKMALSVKGWPPCIVLGNGYALFSGPEIQVTFFESFRENSCFKK